MISLLKLRHVEAEVTEAEASYVIQRQRSYSKKYGYKDYGEVNCCDV